MSFRLIAASAKIAIRALVLFSLSGLAVAENETQIVARVAGEITVNTNGSVKAVSLTKMKDAKFEHFLSKKIMSWAFSPMEINGNPVESINEFSFDVIATLGADNTLRKIQFSDVRIEESALEVQINKKRGYKPSRKPNITYPMSPLYDGAEAKVQLAFDVASDGKVKKAEVFKIEIMNADRKNVQDFAKIFSKYALQGVLNKQWTLAELAQANCKNGCIGIYMVDFVINKGGAWAWRKYQNVPQDPIPWVVASQLIDMNESEKSQLVRLKDDPTGKPIDIGG